MMDEPRPKDWLIFIILQYIQKEEYKWNQKIYFIVEFHKLSKINEIKY